MIIDTDVLIWFLRGNEKAEKAVIEAIPFSISIVTYMELLQGMRNKQEMEKMKNAFAKMKVSIVPISEEISYKAAEYVEMYSLSHSMEMADAFIASTCINSQEVLMTANDKHYRFIDQIKMDVFRP